MIVRVDGATTDRTASTIDCILRDLIVDQGVMELVVDLSQATNVSSALVHVLDLADDRITGVGGRLEIRTPSTPPQVLVELAAEIPTFAPLTPEQG